MVPGHEIVGRVAKVGDHVKKWKPGHIVGVGCFVDSCRRCEAYRAGEEQYCEVGMTLTYNGYERDGKTPTYGGLLDASRSTKTMCCRSRRAYRTSARAVALRGHHHLFAAQHFGLKEGDKLAVVGLSGLGHMAVKFGHANFCAEKGVASDVEVIPIGDINEAYERMLKNDVRYRFVIDIASLRDAA